MIEWQWVVVISLFSLLVGLLLGYCRIMFWHYKNTGKWISDEIRDIKSKGDK